MNLTSIPQFARNANRLREILTILSKYSLADWISRLDLDFARGLFKNSKGEKLASLTHDTRIRLALGELGPTFIKLGQMLSTRPDMIGPGLAKELTKLQKAAPEDTFPEVRKTIEAELGQPLKELFAEFQEKPIASASIAQVHRARLTSGPWVVVKVQHPDIEAKVRVDLDILVGLADLAEQHISELRKYRPRATAGEFQRMLLRELDFGREERNLQQFAENFANEPGVHFPKPYSELSTGRVLTMELLDGVTVADPARLKELGYDLEDVARRGASVFLDMIFRDGFYHADPHPGNILVLPDSVIGMIDCGMVGRLDDPTREAVEELLMAIVQRDSVRMTSVLTRIGSLPARLDHAGLNADITEFMSYYGSRPLQQLNLAQALTEMTGIIRRYEILLPAGMALLIKVLVMLEGTSRLLNPNFDLISLIRPYHRKLLMRYLSPRRRLQKIRHMVNEWQRLGEMLPRTVVDILQQVQGSRLEFQIEHKHLEQSVNRLVFGIVSSALFLGSTLLLATKVPPTYEDISILGAVGLVVSTMQAVRLFWAIKKSGRLD